MFTHVIEAKYIDDYKIWLKFDDGVEGIVDLESELWGEVFSPLKDKNNFRNFEIGKISETLEWPEFNADIAPEFLKENLK